MWTSLLNIMEDSWTVCGQMAPYLIFGFLMAGALSVLISPRWIERHLGGRGMWPVLKASLVGVPMPLCSCGVLPVATSLKQHGASSGATTAFLLSTPQTGVDSIAITYALLGPVFAIFRPITALLTGLVGGAGVAALNMEHKQAAPDRPAACCSQTKPATACCAQTQPPSSQAKQGSCCAGHTKAPGKLFQALKYGLVTLPREIGPALLLGVVISGAMTSLFEAQKLSAYLGGGIGAMFILMTAGIPVYVCATASVPIAAGLMHMGASPGAALAFLMAGPATNAAAFTTIVKVLGKKTAGIYLTTVAASAIGFGLLLDGLVPLFDSDFLPSHSEHVHQANGWFHHASATALILVIAGAFLTARKMAKVQHKARA